MTCRLLDLIARIKYDGMESNKVQMALKYRATASRLKCSMFSYLRESIGKTLMHTA